MTHKQLINDANEALDRLFADMSVSKETTLDDLEMIIENLQIRCESLRNEINNDN